MRIALIFIVHLFLLSSCATKKITTSADGKAITPQEATEDKAIQNLPPPKSSDLDGSAEVMQIPVEVNAEVEKWIEYFQGRGRGYFERYLERSTRYIPMMKKVLKENGVPEDLIYIAMIESGFSAKIRSRAKAVGFWQFIGGTGKHYGLRVNNMVDERYDPVRSTEAAAAYFKGLYNLFGSWYLAIASYNVGENRIKTMVMRNYTRDFWQLAIRKQLPAETTQYIPKFLAARLISREPEKYGFSGLNYEGPMEFDVITASDAIDMRALAKAMKIDYEEIRDLNPAYKSQVAPVLSNTAMVRVPAGTQEAAKLVLNEAIVKNKRYVVAAEEPIKGNFTRYRVKRGETLSAIAQRFDVSIENIVKANRIHRNRIRPGQTLRIPSSALSVKSQKVYVLHRGPAQKLEPIIYVVRRGDTLSKIAEKHDVTVTQLIRKNRLSKLGKVMRGQKLVIPPNA